MGRAKGHTNHNVSALATRSDVVRRPPPVSSLSAALTSIVRSLGAVAASRDEFEDYLAVVDEKASLTSAGRGGRLFTAFDDLFHAQQLASSADHEEQRLAEAVSDNALHHAGPLIATFDPGSPLLAPLRRALSDYGAARGPSQIAYLRAGGWLEGIEVATLESWERSAGDGYVEAFASARGPFSKKGEPRPPWRALSLMERAAHARERLLDMPAPAAESEAAHASALAIGRAEKLLKNGVAYLADINSLKSSDQVSRTGPQEATLVQTIAEALTSPRTAALNAEMAASQVVERHRQLVNEGTAAESKTPVLAVADARWLDLMMNYSVTITRSVCQSSLALNSEGKIILLGPEVAQDAILAGHHEAFDEIVTHELVHTTQPKAQGSPLPDRAHRQAAPSSSRHLIFEDQLLEGATQAQTNYLRRLHDRDYHGAVTDIYPFFATMVDEAQRASGADPELFYRELSATPGNRRTAYLAQRLLGRDDERAQRDLFEPLLNLNIQAEAAAQRAGGALGPVLDRHRALTRSLFEQLRNDN